MLLGLRGPLKVTLRVRSTLSGEVQRDCSMLSVDDAVMQLLLLLSLLTPRLYSLPLLQNDTVVAAAL